MVFRAYLFPLCFFLAHPVRKKSKFEKPTTGIKCRLSNLSVHKNKRHQGSLFKVQIPKHLSPEFIPLRLGWGPRIYTCMCLMQVICKLKWRNSDAKESLMILELEGFKIGSWFSLLPAMCPWANHFLSLASVFLSLQ